MSRCFPFPPPGYEKKLRVEDVTLLAKEKDKERKEKKHKKDKKKEKKEGRGKDNEKSEERHKEKDKAKHKHKDKEKKSEKKRSHDEKRLETDRSLVEKVGSSSPQTILRVPDRDRGKAEVFDGMASRSNGAYLPEGKSGFDQLVNGQRVNCRSKSPKLAFVFSDGGEQRTVQIGRPMQSNINKSAEGIEMLNHCNSNIMEEKRKAENTPETLDCDGALFDRPKEATAVQELKRRIKDENGATGSQGGANGYASSLCKTKEGSMLRNESYRLENRQKDNDRSKVQRVAIVHNFKGGERGGDIAGGVDMSLKSPLEEMERNGFYGNGAVNNRTNIQFMDADRNKARKEEKVKKESANVVKLSRFAMTGSNSTINPNRCTFKTGNKTAEVSTGKRKEPEANGLLHDNETRPSKLQRTVLSSQPALGDGKYPRAWPTSTSSSSKQAPANSLKLDGEEHKPMVISHVQLPFGSTKPSFSAKANGNVGAQELPLAPTKLPLSLGNVRGVMGSQEPLPVSTTADKVHETILPDESHLGRTNLQSSIGKIHGTADSQDLPSITTTSGKFNGTTTAHGSRLGPTKLQSSSGKIHGTADSQELPLVSTTSGKFNGTTTAHGSPLGTTNPSSSIRKVHGTTDSREFPLVSVTTEKLNGSIGPHGSHPLTKVVPHIEKFHKIVDCQEPAKPPLTAGKVSASPNGADGSHPVTLKHPSTSRKEKRKDKSSSKQILPHPDTKYLSSILSVPKMEELPEFDDQQWLFESKSCLSKERHVGYGTHGGSQVWAKAVHIESEDVFALPYVIPY